MGSLPTGGKSTRRRSNRRSTTGILAVAAVIAGLLVAGVQPSAAASSKTFNATCTGADGKTIDLLSNLPGGGSLATPVTVAADAPAFVEPGQTGIPFSLSLSFSLDAKTVDTVAALSSNIKVSNVSAPLAVSGPTSTTAINASLPDQDLTLAVGTPFNAAFPPINGVLNDIGNGGLIKVSTQELFFTITLASGPITHPLNFKCTTGATVLSLPVKVAGSPNIAQPIEVPTQAGQPATVDVLGQFVTNGTTKDGVVQQVDPSTLKILEGDAKIVDGKIVATGPAAGQSTEVTFEVCAGTINIAEADPGTTEVQEIRLFFDPNNQALKREMGSRFAFNGESADKVVWSMDFGFFFPFTFVEPNPPKDEKPPAGKDSWWQKNVNNYALNAHTWPTAEEMQAGLESIPTIGPGNVKVTRGEIVKNSSGNVPEGVTLKGATRYMPYIVEFSGALANKAHDQIVVAQLYSFLPIEIRDNLLSLLDELGGEEGEGGGGPKTPIPPGLTAKEYVDQLSATAGQQGTNGDLLGQIATIQLMLKVIGENLMSIIDIGAITSLLSDLFQAPPGIVTLTQGEDPAPEQKQELCSQGIVTLTSGAAVLPAEAGTGGDQQASVAGATELKVAG
jgi:hypothetical protein